MCVHARVHVRVCVRVCVHMGIGQHTAPVAGRSDQALQGDVPVGEAKLGREGDVCHRMHNTSTKSTVCLPSLVGHMLDGRRCRTLGTIGCDPVALTRSCSRGAIGHSMELYNQHVLGTLMWVSPSDATNWHTQSAAQDHRTGRQ